MLLFLLEKGKDKFLVELGKVAVKTAVTTAAATISKKLIDEAHNKIKGKNDKKGEEEKEKDSTTKED